MLKNIFLIIFLVFILFISGQTKSDENLKSFLPKEFILQEKIFGDLNKDGAKDCIMIIKGTDKNKIIKDDEGKLIDRNRRGIIILFKIQNQYELATKNYECFSSENEDGGIYYAPDLLFEIKKNNLYISYSHGRYGYWKYTLRYQNSDFEIIGYDTEDMTNGHTDSITSINFSTKKKITKINQNQDPYSNDVFDTKVEKILIEKPLRLSEIKDFDNIEMSKY